MGQKLTTSQDIPRPHTVREYDNRVFADHETSFSSFTYLIDAARVLGIALATAAPYARSVDSLVKSAELNVLSWHLHLPPGKRDPVDADGNVDERMFLAHMLINT